MPRIRTIKPEFWGDEKLSPLPPVTRLVFLGLLSMADDGGRLVDSEKQIEAFIFPDGDYAREVRDALATLSDVGRVVRGHTPNGQGAIQIVHWARHQKVDHPNLKAMLPELLPPEHVTPIRESLASESREIRDSTSTGTSTADQRAVPGPSPTTTALPVQVETALGVWITGHRYPESLRASIRVLLDPRARPSYSEAVVCQAIREMQGAGRPFKASALAAWCQNLATEAREGPPPPRGRPNGGRVGSGGLNTLNDVPDAVQPRPGGFPADLDDLRGR